MAHFSGPIPENIIEEVIARSDIASVVGEYVRFTKTSGQNQFGLCPFHAEDTPSFSVSVPKQIYYCFGCHKGGNVINFIMEIEKISYPEAIRFLAERLQITIPEPQDQAYRKSGEKRDAIRAALLDSARYFYTALHGDKGQQAREYLNERGILPQTAKFFGLGYAPDEWEGLYSYLKQKGYTDEVLDASGIFSKSKKGNRIDLFRGRLMFPIFDTMGKIVAYGGRIIGDGMPKYINSPESPVYSKQKVLYGLNFAKTVRSKKLIIVEGYMDVIAMHQAGIKNVVASLGTALTDKQMTLAARYAEELVLFYDSDRAGQEATVRGLKLLMAKMQRQTGLHVKLSVGSVPDGKDPDEFIRTYGAEAFSEIVNNALAVMDYLVEFARLKSTEDGQLDPRAFQELACTFLSWENNAILKERAAGKVAHLLGVSVASVMREVEVAEKQLHQEQTRTLRSGKVTQQETITSSTDTSVANREELMLLCMLCMIPELYQKMPDRPITTDFSQGAMRKIAQEVLVLCAENAIDVTKLMTIADDYQLNGMQARALFSHLIMNLKSLPDERKQVKDVMYLLYRTRLIVYKKRKRHLAKLLDGALDDKDRQSIKASFDEVERYLLFLREQKNDYWDKI